MNWKSKQKMPSREQQDGSHGKKKNKQQKAKQQNPQYSRDTEIWWILTLETENLFGIFEKSLR